MLPPPAGHGDLSALLVDVDALAGDEGAAEPADAVRPPGVPHVDVPVPAAGQELLGVGGVVHWQWVKIQRLQWKCRIKYPIIVAINYLGKCMSHTDITIVVF